MYGVTSLSQASEWHGKTLANFKVINLLNEAEAKAVNVLGTTLVPHIIPVFKLSIIILK